MNIIDIIGIIIVVISGLIAFKKGFVKTFFSFISTFVALILAFALCNTGVILIKENTNIDEWLQETLTASLSSISKNEDEEETLEKESIEVKSFETLPQNFKDMIGLDEYKENAKNVIVEKSVDFILKILSWIIIYFVARIVLMIICTIFNSIMSIPILKQINNLAGLGVGVLLGLFRIYFVLALVSFLTSVISMDGLMAWIKNSMIISQMYENNILVSLIL